MRDEMPLLKRFLSKLVRDVLPAALASVIGGFVFSHFQLGPFAYPPQTVAAQVVPASAEMMQLLRDEHDLVADMVKAQLASSNGFDAQPVAAAERLQTIALR